MLPPPLRMRRLRSRILALGPALAPALTLAVALVLLVLVGCSVETTALAPTGDASAVRDSGADAPDTRPPPPDLCAPGIEVCNAMDDDCDGTIDEAFDLSTDPQNCGICGMECPPDPANAAPACTRGGCDIVCDTGFADCDGNLGTGCETSITTAANCGGCGMACSGTWPLCETLGGASRCVADCGPISTLCPPSTCASLGEDPAHCGACDNLCPPSANAEPSCAGGACAVSCDSGYADCDAVTGNGCEVSLDSPTNCGACGVDCGRPNAVAGCDSAGCSFACEVGYADCDGAEANGCELAATTLTDCGGCGVACDVVNGTPDCSLAYCAVDACDAQYADCNGLVADGCESRPDEDEDHCGACGASCSGVCNGGECHSNCLASDCNTTCDPSSGACTCSGNAHCGFLCSDAGGCDITCDGNNTECTVLGSSPAVFDGRCTSGADCDFRVQSGGDITVECRDSNTACEVDCRGAATCQVRCHRMAECRLLCDGATGTCGYTECAGAGAMTCRDGSIVCGQRCPSSP